MAEKMKAYEVTERYGDGASMVVFATSKSKAMYVAYRNSESAEYLSFIEFVDRHYIGRCGKADSAYKGKECMDWYDPDDRLFLVKELDWACVDGHSDDCRKCVAHEFCDMGMSYIKEENNG